MESALAIAMTHEEYKAAFMAAVKGYTASVVTQCLSTMTPGVNWLGCSKGYMAERYADSATGKSISFGRSYTVDLAVLTTKCAAHKKKMENQRTWLRR